MNKTVQVTQMDIDGGIPEDACRCPIALALLREFGPDCGPSVDPDRVDFGKPPGKTYEGPMPSTFIFEDYVEMWIQAFDAGTPQGPIELDMEWDGDDAEGYITMVSP